MALTKQSIVDKVEVVGQFNSIQVRTAQQILENGQVISSTFHRHVLQPGADLTNEDSKVVAIANAVWTDELIAAYQQHLQEQQSVE